MKVRLAMDDFDEYTHTVIFENENEKRRKMVHVAAKTPAEATQKAKRMFRDYQEKGYRIARVEKI